MRLRLLAVAGCALAAVLAVPAAASAAPSCAGLPKHSNFPVVDAANVLDPQKAAYLTGDLMRLAMTSDLVVVAATVRDLGGEDVSPYARRLFDCWGVGDADSDNGVLILVAMRERRVRIELGRGVTAIDQTELDKAIAAMTAPLRGGNVTGALRAAAVQVAAAAGATLPDIEAFVRTNGAEGLDDLGMTNIPGLPGTCTGGGGPGTGLPGTGVDLPPFDDTVDIPNANPFRAPPLGGTVIPVLVIVVLVVGVLWTFARAAFRGGSRLASAGQTVWRGGFPVFGAGNRGWEPSLLHGGHWAGGGDSGLSGGGSSGGSSGGPSSFGGGSSGGGGASGSGGSFGGGSSSGGGASGSW